ncbi:Clavaminate synthase-like protein [Trametes elegans]|nr:Clavaminate synthase-like protein [Trametes elegans]
MEPECPKLPQPPSYPDFLEDYLLPNKPVLIGPPLVSSWPAYKVWSNADGGINWSFLTSQYGALEVTVADCSMRDFSDQRRATMLFADVVALWEQGEGQTLYVKDWHLARVLQTRHSSVPAPEPFYTTPDIFRDDWMNAYYSAHTEDDFRFVYVGAAGTFTPLHRDVYTSYSWSTNVCGRKRWWLFPPEQTPFLLRKGGEEHMETVYDVRDVDRTLYPHFNRTHPVVVEQAAGETIFVPSGWYHQVENLTACISINHNWCNAVNLPSLYESMCAKVVEVENALEDVRELLAQSSRGGDSGGSDSEAWKTEWVAIVQDVVEKDAGWNWLTFWRMVKHVLGPAAGSLHPTNDILWPQTPPDLMPPTAFVKTRIKQCLGDFVKRSQNERSRVAGLRDILLDIEVLLDS